jgi:hypothetical protein
MPSHASGHTSAGVANRGDVVMIDGTTAKDEEKAVVDAKGVCLFFFFFSRWN